MAVACGQCLPHGQPPQLGEIKHGHPLLGLFGCLGRGGRWLSAESGWRPRSPVVCRHRWRHWHRETGGCRGGRSLPWLLPGLAVGIARWIVLSR
jgi:hypothetical protein